MRYSCICLLLLGILTLQACGEKKSSVEDATAKAVPPNTEQTPDFNENRNAYFGDLHIHTSWSFDAFIYNVRTNPDNAYEFGKGQAIDHFVEGKIQLKRALDFMAVSDHAEYMGVMKEMINPENPLSKIALAKRVRSEDRQTSLEAFGEIGISLARNQPMGELTEREFAISTWNKIIDAANRHYEPGTFTTFPAYEWTSSPSVRPDDSEPFARNLHRNVIYKGDKISEVPFSSFDSQDPEQLWKWMEKEKANGIELLAIPHNANMSDGLMYPDQTFRGRPVDKAYAKLRFDNEPINEVVQIKGQSMAHPTMSPNDEFADFELYPYTFASGKPPTSQPEGSYVREAFQKGMAFEKKLGINPFKFGIIGSSDGHNSAGPVEEDNYFGKFGNRDGSPESRLGQTDKNAFIRSPLLSAAGLTGVWAEENTREAIYEAMERKEVFATSGTRIKVRFFGSFDFSAKSLDQENWLQNAYSNGVPMGSDLPSRSPSTVHRRPSFLIWAIKDPEGANLDRMQVVKLYLDKEGNKKEHIYDVAWAGDRRLGKDNKLPAIGSSVNVKDASYTNDIGSVELKTQWMDPDFDPAESATYYVRVLEIPTPRWSTYDAKTLGIDVPESLQATIQERAWSSPIWYKP